MCLDYRYLYKASLKDDFPLQHMGVLLDNIVGHALISFMDGFLGYSQIWMASKYHAKTSFITLCDTFCYKVMPFGIKMQESRIREL